LPDGEVVHTVGVVTGTVVGGTYAVVGATDVTVGEEGVCVVVVTSGTMVAVVVFVDARDVEVSCFDEVPLP
jgi:hypothetical protein